MLTPDASWLIDTSHPDYLVAAKPAGIGFHDEEGVPGFVSQLKTLPDCAGLHPLHRLDRITSGLILFARHAEAARAFGLAFSSGAIEKYYLALSDHRPVRKQGLVKGAMGRARGGAWRLMRSGEAMAATQFFSYSVEEGLRLFVVRPRTGRTHQIRVALKSVGSPILGDERYGGTPADRGYLHAWALRFTWQGRTMQYMRPPEEGQRFTQTSTQNLIDTLHHPWDLAWPQYTPSHPGALS